MGPLQGCRVLDLGIITAGAATSALLADLGAEVIKVESRQYRDPFRGWASSKLSADTPTAPYFRATNRGKSGISLDLKHPDGHAAFLRLVRQSDVVVENFRRGVLPRLGIGYEVLQAARPSIILASISSQGETGPDADYVSFGTTLEAMGGLAWHTGYAEGPPVVSGRDLNYPDQVVALFAAGMILAAWLDRRRHGRGAHLDISQRELTSFLVGEQFVAPDIGPPRHGNAAAGMAVQDCFRGRDGSWLALSVTPDRLAALDALIGLPTDAADQRRAALERFVADRRPSALQAEFAAAGIAAAAVLDGRGVLDARGTYWRTAMASLEDGGLVKGFPFQLQRAPLAVAADAPQIGADTAAVLARIVGYGEEELAALAAKGAIECAEAA